MGMNDDLRWFLTRSGLEADAKPAASVTSCVKTAGRNRVGKCEETLDHRAFGALTVKNQILYAKIDYLSALHALDQIAFGGFPPELRWPVGHIFFSVNH